MRSHGVLNSAANQKTTELDLLNHLTLLLAVDWYSLTDLSSFENVLLNITFESKLSKIFISEKKCHRRLASETTLNTEVVRAEGSSSFSEEFTVLSFSIHHLYSVSNHSRA